MKDVVSSNPQERAQKLESLIGSLDPNLDQDRKQLTQVILESMNDDTTLVRESAISYAARYIEPEMLGELVADDENATLRNAALTALERQGPYALPHLKQMTKNSNYEVALFAAQILARLKDPASISALLPLLEHDDPNIVQAAAEGLGFVQAREAVPPLIRLLSADMWIQFAAVSALGDIEDARAVEPLLGLCGNDMLAEPALEALKKIASLESVKPLFDLFYQNDRLPLRDHVIIALAAIADKHVSTPLFENGFSKHLISSEQGKQAVDYLASLLEHPHQAPEPMREIVAKAHQDDRMASRGGGVLVQAAVTLILAGKIESLFPSIMRKTMESDSARWVLSLCRKFSDCLSPFLETLIQHEDPSVRRGVFLTAKASSIPHAALWNALQDPNVHVRTAAYTAVGEAKISDAVPILLEKMRTGREDEMATVIDALGQMPAESLVPLEEVFQQPCNEEEVEKALNVLERAKASLFEDQLLPLADSPNPLIRRLVLRVFAHSKREEMEWTIISKLDDPDDVVRTEAVELLVHRNCLKAFPAFLVILEEDDPLRYHVIRALGRFKKAEAVGPLQKLYTEAAPHERIEIIMALVSIGDVQSLPFLRARLDESEQEVRRAAMYGLARLVSKMEIDFLSGFAQDTDWYVRNEVAWGLGRLAVERSRDVLLSLARDTEPVVARTAREALSKFGRSE